MSRRPRHKKPWSLDTTRATVGVKRMNRKVRVSIVAKPDLEFEGHANAASFAYADLDDVEIDRLVRRLQAIRGGRTSLK